jgi:NTP pyrophosphatase (non-canonical NTP hydrolase)
MTIEAQHEAPPLFANRPTLGGIEQIPLKDSVDNLVAATHGAAHDNGWHDDIPQRADYRDGKQHFQARTNWIVSKLALIMGEASEAIEELREGIDPRATYYRDERPESDTYHTTFSEQLWLDGVPQYKPEGVAAEIADVIVRAGDLSGVLGLDMGKALIEKVHYNSTRGQRHGGAAF